MLSFTNFFGLLLATPNTENAAAPSDILSDGSRIVQKVNSYARWRKDQQSTINSQQSYLS